MGRQQLQLMRPGALPPDVVQERLERRVVGTFWNVPLELGPAVVQRHDARRAGGAQRPQLQDQAGQQRAARVRRRSVCDRRLTLQPQLQ